MAVARSALFMQVSMREEECANRDASVRGGAGCDDAGGLRGRARAGRVARAQQKPSDLANASLEDLMKVEVTSVSKKEQTLSRTAAAVFVITQDDIQRSGATNIPDLLRMVPGMDVAQINASTWAISARGLNSEFSNELLVMMDGRNVYTASFGGVFWDTVDLPLETIEPNRSDSRAGRVDMG